MDTPDRVPGNDVGPVDGPFEKLLPVHRLEILEMLDLILLEEARPFTFGHEPRVEGIHDLREQRSQCLPRLSDALNILCVPVPDYGIVFFHDVVLFTGRCERRAERATQSSRRVTYSEHLNDLSHIFPYVSAGNLTINRPAPGRYHFFLDADPIAVVLLSLSRLSLHPLHVTPKPCRLRRQLLRRRSEWRDRHFRCWRSALRYIVTCVNRMKSLIAVGV
jgi:hypothetical protein